MDDDVVVLREPTRDQLLAMAYVDGELSEPSRRAFEDVLHRDPVLMKEVAELEALERILREVCSASLEDLGGMRFGRAGIRRRRGRRRR